MKKFRHGARYPLGMRYKAAYTVKIAVDSLMLSVVLPYFVVVLLRLGRIAFGVEDYVAGVRGAVIAEVTVAIVVALTRVVLQRYPQITNGLPPSAQKEGNLALFLPALRGYCGMVMFFACWAMEAMAFFFLWYTPILASNGFLLSFFGVVIAPIPLFYWAMYSIDRVLRGKEGEALKELQAQEQSRLQAARESVACWRLGWAAWAAEGLIYAGLSLALWQALASGGVEWRQWWVATVAAMGVAGLRVLERLSPQWIPSGRPEAWAWGVRAVRLGVAVAACAGI